ncbi:hypothetical protein ACFL1F_00525 [Chlamydiota bacterium]
MKKIISIVTLITFILSQTPELTAYLVPHSHITGHLQTVTIRQNIEYNILDKVRGYDDTTTVIKTGNAPVHTKTKTNLDGTVETEDVGAQDLVPEKEGDVTKTHTTITYNGSGQLTSQISIDDKGKRNGVMNMRYDSMGRVVKDTQIVDGTQIKRKMAYNHVNQIVSQVEKSKGYYKYTADIKYNGLGQKVSATTTEAIDSGKKRKWTEAAETYTYDTRGNLTETDKQIQREWTTKIKKSWIKQVIGIVIAVAVTVISAGTLGPVVAGAIQGVMAGLGAAATVATAIGAAAAAAVISAVTQIATGIYNMAVNGASFKEAFSGFFTNIAIAAVTAGIASGLGAVFLPSGIEQATNTLYEGFRKIADALLKPIKDITNFFSKIWYGGKETLTMFGQIVRDTVKQVIMSEFGERFAEKFGILGTAIIINLIAGTITGEGEPASNLLKGLGQGVIEEIASEIIDDPNFATQLLQAMIGAVYDTYINSLENGYKLKISMQAEAVNKEKIAQISNEIITENGFMISKDVNGNISWMISPEGDIFIVDENGNIVLLNDENLLQEEIGLEYDLTGEISTTFGGLFETFAKFGGLYELVDRDTLLELFKTVMSQTSVEVFVEEQELADKEAQWSFGEFKERVENIWESLTSRNVEDNDYALLLEFERQTLRRPIYEELITQIQELTPEDFIKKRGELINYFTYASQILDEAEKNKIWTMLSYVFGEYMKGKEPLLSKLNDFAFGNGVEEFVAYRDNYGTFEETKELMLFVRDYGHEQYLREEYIESLGESLVELYAQQNNIEKIDQLPMIALYELDPEERAKILGVKKGTHNDFVLEFISKEYQQGNQKYDPYNFTIGDFKQESELYLKMSETFADSIVQMLGGKTEKNGIIMRKFYVEKGGMAKSLEDAVKLFNVLPFYEEGMEAMVATQLERKITEIWTPPFLQKNIKDPEVFKPLLIGFGVGSLDKGIELGYDTIPKLKVGYDKISMKFPAIGKAGITLGWIAIGIETVDFSGDMAKVFKNDYMTFGQKFKMGTLETFQSGLSTFVGYGSGFLVGSLAEAYSWNPVLAFSSGVLVGTASSNFVSYQFEKRINKLLDSYYKDYLKRESYIPNDEYKE